MKPTFYKCYIETVYILGTHRFQDEALELKAMEPNGYTKIRILKKMIYDLCNLIAYLNNDIKKERYTSATKKATELMNRSVELLEECLSNQKST